MAKKVFCKDCVNRMSWAHPHTITEENYEYAKHCLNCIRRSCVCGETMKTKGIDNQQYCNKFRASVQIGDYIHTGREDYERQLRDADALEQKIKEYEKEHNITPKQEKTFTQQCIEALEKNVAEKVTQTGYIIVDEETGMYYNGMNQFKKDLRDCKIYHTQKGAENTATSIGGNRKPILKKVIITIE